MAEPRERYRIYEPHQGTLVHMFRELVRQINDVNLRMAQAFSESFVYGGIEAVSNTVETAISAANTKVQFLNFTKNEVANGATPDFTQGHIEIQYPGDYLIIFSCSMDSPAGAGFTLHVEIYTNNGSTHLSAFHANRDFAGGGGESAPLTITGVEDLKKGDTVEVWLTNSTGAENVLIEDASLVVVKVSNNA